jgi:hypothetical protein
MIQSMQSKHANLSVSAIQCIVHIYLYIYTQHHIPLPYPTNLQIIILIFRINKPLLRSRPSRVLYLVLVNINIGLWFRRCRSRGCFLLLFLRLT